MKEEQQHQQQQQNEIKNNKRVHKTMYDGVTGAKEKPQRIPSVKEDKKKMLIESTSNSCHYFGSENF